LKKKKGKERIDMSQSTGTAAKGNNGNPTPGTTTSTTTPTTSYCGKNQQHSKNNQCQRTTSNRTTMTLHNSFRGTVKEMNGHIFQCHGKSTEQNQFGRTMEELKNYIGLYIKNFQHDMKKMVKDSRR
jgi:hypothetical protein